MISEESESKGHHLSHAGSLQVPGGTEMSFTSPVRHADPWEGWIFGSILC